MASPTRGAEEERVPTAGAGPTASGAPLAREEAKLRSKEALGSRQGWGRGEPQNQHCARGDMRGGVGPPLPTCAATASRGQRARRREGRS